MITRKNMKGGVCVFFKRRHALAQEDEFTRMRKELMEHSSESFNEMCIQQFDDFAASIISDLKNGLGYDGSRLEQAQADVDRALNITQLQIKEISRMDDGDIKQLYYQTFHRWHPLE